TGRSQSSQRFLARSRIESFVFLGIGTRLVSCGFRWTRPVCPIGACANCDFPPWCALLIISHLVLDPRCVSQNDLSNVVRLLLRFTATRDHDLANRLVNVVPGLQRPVA